ncbi:response regulator transcription factor [Streptomyces sp. NPDC088915]|uniref:response regulator transcription factor n=1 Tax=Streptomyces sp. NPDC088915 TaxID=3365912 RepID=UPI00381DED38
MNQSSAVLDSSFSLVDEPWRTERPTTMRDGQVRPAAWRLLLVDGSVGEAEALAGGLRRHGHEVEIVTTGGDAMKAYSDAHLVLLDLDLPDLDGLEVCRGIREESGIPIIAVTARATELDRVLGLQAGADDYLAKPYGFHELLARIEAVMRRAQPASLVTPAVITHGRLRIDTGSREVFLDGKRVDTTRKEFDLLQVLASHPDTVIPRRVLMREVWGDSWSRRTVDTHISTLRNKIGAQWIVTVRGVGFRFGPTGS